MNRRHERIPSPQLGRRVHLLCFGWFGKPVLVFPSASGMAHDWEMHGMIDALAPIIHSGRIKLYCPESYDMDSLVRGDLHPSERIRRVIAYQNFITETLVPWIREDCRSENMRLVTTGCSMGGYHAVNVALKNPDLFQWALGMSGRYDVVGMMGGFQNMDMYYNNPVSYVANMHGDDLERIRQRLLVSLVVGLGAYEEGCIEETHRLADLFVRKGIPHERDVWGFDSRHDWDWWQKHLIHHFGRYFCDPRRPVPN